MDHREECDQHRTSMVHGCRQPSQAARLMSSSASKNLSRALLGPKTAQNGSNEAKGAHISRTSSAPNRSARMLVIFYGGAALPHYRRSVSAALTELESVGTALDASHDGNGTDLERRETTTTQYVYRSVRKEKNPNEWMETRQTRGAGGKDRDLLFKFDPLKNGDRSKTYSGDNKEHDGGDIQLNYHHAARYEWSPKECRKTQTAADSNSQKCGNVVQVKMCDSDFYSPKNDGKTCYVKISKRYYSLLAKHRKMGLRCSLTPSAHATGLYVVGHGAMIWGTDGHGNVKKEQTWDMWLAGIRGNATYVDKDRRIIFNTFQGTAGEAPTDKARMAYVALAMEAADREQNAKSGSTHLSGMLRRRDPPIDKFDVNTMNVASVTKSGSSEELTAPYAAWKAKLEAHALAYPEFKSLTTCKHPTGKDSKRSYCILPAAGVKPQVILKSGKSADEIKTTLDEIGALRYTAYLKGDDLKDDDKLRHDKELASKEEDLAHKLHVPRAARVLYFRELVKEKRCVMHSEGATLDDAVRAAYEKWLPLVQAYNEEIEKLEAWENELKLSHKGPRRQFLPLLATQEAKKQARQRAKDAYSKMGNALEHRIKSLKRELGVDFDMLFREIAKPGQPVVNYLLGEDGPDGGEDLDPNLEGGDRTDVVTMWSHYMEGQKDDPDKDLYADFCVVTGQGNLAKLYKDLIPKIEKIRKQAWSKGVTKYKGVEKYKDVAMGNCRNSIVMTFTQRLKSLVGKEEQVSVSQDTYTQAIHKFKQDRLKKEARKLAKRSVIKFL